MRLLRIVKSSIRWASFVVGRIESQNGIGVGKARNSQDGEPFVERDWVLPGRSKTRQDKEGRRLTRASGTSSFKDGNRGWLNTKSEPSWGASASSSQFLGIAREPPQVIVV